jgi:hypothetical protein
LIDPDGLPEPAMTDIGAGAPRTSNIERGCYTKYVISFVRHYQYELYRSEERKVLCFLAD